MYWLESSGHLDRRDSQLSAGNAGTAVVAPETPGLPKERRNAGTACTAPETPESPIERRECQINHWSAKTFVHHSGRKVCRSTSSPATLVWGVFIYDHDRRIIKYGFERDLLFSSPNRNTNERRYIVLSLVISFGSRKSSVP